MASLQKPDWTEPPQRNEKTSTTPQHQWPRRGVITRFLDAVYPDEICLLLNLKGDFPTHLIAATQFWRYPNAQASDLSPSDIPLRCAHRRGQCPPLSIVAETDPPHR